ncbi:MAG: YaaR family protein [Oscillospiraceae bacterium]|jgi:uncharacterized protein YaaR (DUF327 family)|nr:YaaR family protein [Oscillospiraceae bacterium]
MKIQSVKAQNSPTVGALAPHSHENGGVRGIVFQRTLSTLNGQKREDELNQMVAKIDEQGKRLSEHIDVAEFARYRALIKEFLDDLVSNGYEFEKDNAFDGRGRHRFLVTIKTVNEKLDELGKEIMTEQADNLSVLDAVDDIRGLIVDIFS